MAATPSNMMPIGTIAPDFQLLDTVSNKNLSLQELKSPAGTMIIFMCNHCPFVKHILKKFIEVAHEYQAKGISFIAINSNDVLTYPDDSPEKMQQLANQLNFHFPYLYDETQEIAKKYQAACTPDLYLFDAQLRCVYRGQFDDSRPGNNAPVNGKDLIHALDNLLKGNPIDPNQKPSIGCNIKWKQHA